MSDIDLTEAAEALFHWNTPSDPYFVIHGRSGEMSEGDAYLPIVTAAYQFIEAAVREQVRAEIEADREAVKRRHGSDPEDLYVRGRLYGSSVAAGIARHGAPS